MNEDRQTRLDDEPIRFWTLNPKHVNLIDMVAVFIIVRLFVFPAMWSM